MKYDTYAEYLGLMIEDLFSDDETPLPNLFGNSKFSQPNPRFAGSEVSDSPPELQRQDLTGKPRTEKHVAFFGTGESSKVGVAAMSSVKTDKFSDLITLAETGESFNPSAFARPTCPDKGKERATDEEVAIQESFGKFEALVEAPRVTEKQSSTQDAALAQDHGMPESDETSNASTIFEPPPSTGGEAPVRSPEKSETQELSEKESPAQSNEVAEPDDEGAEKEAEAQPEDETTENDGLIPRKKSPTPTIKKKIFGKMSRLFTRGMRKLPGGKEKKE